jgi:hypothetical protein
MYVATTRSIFRPHFFASLALIGALGFAGCGDEVGSQPDAGADGDDDGNDDDPSMCRKIDLLIAVDPSSSMAEELSAMSDVFGDFAGAIMDLDVNFQNLRTGVIDSCPKSPTLNRTNRAGDECWSREQPWISSDSSQMVSDFQCVGDLDPTSSCNMWNDEDEQPIKSIIAALQPGANPGFLRDDALLVMMAITDEDEEMVPDAVDNEVYSGAEIREISDDLFDELVDLKGDVRREVFIGIGGGKGGCEHGTYGSATEASIVNGTADEFIGAGYGVKRDLCKGDLAQSLHDAMDTIQAACRDFNPVH